MLPFSPLSSRCGPMAPPGSEDWTQQEQETAGLPPLYTKWQAAGHAAELHIYAKGGHGFGMLKKDLPSDGWIERFGEWLAGQGFLT